QARDLATDLPTIVASLSASANDLLAQVGLSTDSGIVDTILGQLGSLGGVLARIPGVIVGFVSAFVLVTFMSALMILERDRARDWIMRFVAPRDRPTLDGLLRKAAQRLGAYVRGQVPIAGPIIAGVLMILVALTESPLQALLTVVLVTIIQQSESLVLVPVIQGR